MVVVGFYLQILSKKFLLKINFKYMIPILTGSHSSDSLHNKQKFNKINELLYSKENPIYKKFYDMKVFFMLAIL